jgi:hypothetical protein
MRLFNQSLMRGKVFVMLKKARIVGFALFAVLAFCAVTASSAFAESEWLFNGAAVTTPLAVETEGSVTLVKYSEAKGATIQNEVVCKGIFDGTVQGKVDEITDVLDPVTHEAIGSLDEGDVSTPSLSCEAVTDNVLAGCAVGLVSVWVDNLNLTLGDTWLTRVTLDGGTTFLDELFESNLAGLFPGYEIECKTLFGITATELCESIAGGPTTSTLTNNANGSVHGVFAKPAVTERGKCTLTGAESAEVLGEGDTWESTADLVHEAGLSVS